VIRRHRISIALGAALIVSLGLNWDARRPTLQRNFEYFPDMVRTARFNAFEPNPNFPDGSTLRLPVPGTIPRGLPPLPPVAAQEQPVNPFTADDRAAVERGAVVYRNFCTPCHGADGRGNGVVIEYGFPKPPTLLRARARDMTDIQIFRLLTSGRGNMASYAAQVSRDDRWKVILYLRELQQKSPPEGQ
jgi:mono/diheme cytochrome c family protein